MKLKQAATGRGGKTALAGAGVMVLFFLVTGGAFVSLGTFLPAGTPRNVVVCVMGFVFAAAFVALLVSRVMSMFSGNDRLKSEVALALVNVALLLTAFAAIYYALRVEDASGSGSPKESRSFADMLYFSVVTFTTVGYGDYQPVGAARVMSGLQAFVGYIVLGILASSSASVLENIAKSSKD